MNDSLFYCIMYIIFILGTLILVLLTYIRWSYGYWERRNVQYLKPKFPLGNNTTILPKGISIGIISNDFYEKFKLLGIKIGGVFFGIDPQLVITDPEYAKNILIKDFQYFNDRGIYSCESDPITINIFSQAGREWKFARNTFTSIFTRAKISMIMETIKKCSDEMVTSLEQNAKYNTDVNILEVLACFTTDVIGSVIFGIECNSFKHPDAEFRKMGRKLFEEFSFRDRVNLFFCLYFPKLARKLGISNIQPEVSHFFYTTVRETVEYREKNNIVRNDFLQLLIEKKNSDLKISMNEVIAQAFRFFTAGFETSSTTAHFVLFELAQNQVIQNKVRDEMNNVLRKFNNAINYEAIADMKYLDQVFYESLRKWPVVTTLTRVCTKNYTFPDRDLTVERGTGIIIPVLSFHRDAHYFPNPLKFDPDRFSEKPNDEAPFFPFGDGPRNCLGLRFGKILVKIGLISILRKYQVSLSYNTPTTPDLDPHTFIIHTKQKVLLRLKKLHLD